MSEDSHKPAAGRIEQHLADSAAVGPTPRLRISHGAIPKRRIPQAPLAPQATAKPDSAKQQPAETGSGGSPNVPPAGFRTTTGAVLKRRPPGPSPVDDAQREQAHQAAAEGDATTGNPTRQAKKTATTKAKPRVPKKATTVKRARKAESGSRPKRRHPVEPPAPVVPTRTKEGRFVKGNTASWYGRPCKPKPPVVDFFRGLSTHQIAANPVLTAAAKLIPTTAGGKQTEMYAIEAIYTQMAHSAMKQHHQAGREFGRQTEKALTDARKDAHARWQQLMTIKITLTAELIRSDQGAPRSAMLLMRDPRQIMWLHTDELVTIESLELAERIRWLTRMEPRHRLAVEELDQKYRASTDAAEREKYREEIRSRVSRVKELESYGLREMPNAETIVRAQAEHYMKTGQLPFD